MSVRIALFGQPRVLSADGSQEFALPRKTLNVLGYLILNRRRAPARDSVAFALFPEEDEERARSSLRRNLSYLLSALPNGKDLVGADAERIAWTAGADVHVDVIAFERAAGEGRDADALAEYAGDLLPTIYDEWTVAERERLRGMYHDVLVRTIARERSQRQYDAATATAHRLLSDDPWREDIVRILMAVRYEAGDRAGALAAFERFADSLRREMAAEPMPETIAVRDAVLRGVRLATSDAPRKAIDASVEPALPFVGRDDAMELARDAWRNAADGTRGLLFVAGEGGVGKTRFATELARLTEREGGVVVRGYTSASGEQRPYEAFVDALRSGPGVLEEHASATLTDDRAARLRLFESVRRRLSDLSHARPLVVILEDLHWAGPSTIDLLEFVAGRLERAPVLFVATLRSEEMAAAPALRALRRQLRGRSFVREIVLGRLSAPDALAAARAVLPAAVDDAALARALAWVDGVPLLLVEAVRDLAAGRVSNASNVTALVGERLERLTPNAETAVFFGATVGERFDLETIEAATGWRDDEALDAIGELIDGGLVRATARAPALTFAFTHDLIRVAATERIAAPDRARAHGMVARALLAQSAHDEALAVAIARHFAEAGERRRGAEQYLRAARYALSVFANEDARESASQGLALCDDGDPDRRALDYDLVDARERSLARIGDTDARRADARRLVTLAVGDEATAVALGRLAEACIADAGERRMAVERLSAVAGASERAATAYAYASARHAYHEGRFSQAREAALEAAAGFERAGDRHAAIRAQCFAIGCFTRTGAYADGLAEVERLRPLLDESDDAALRVEFHLLAAAMASEMNFEAAMEDARRALDLAIRIGDRWNEAKARQNLGVAASKLRRYDEALDQHERALAAYRDVGDVPQVRDSLLNIAGVRLFCGDFEIGGKLVAEAAEGAAPWLVLRCELLRGAIAVGSEQPAAAQRFLEEAKRCAQALGASYYGIICDVLLAAALSSLGRLDAALAHANQALEASVAIGEPYVEAEARAVAARLLATAGDAEGARRHAERAAEQGEERRSDSYSQILWNVAAAYEALGDPTLARDFACKAAATAVDDALRMPADLAESYLGLPWHRDAIAFLWKAVLPGA